MHRRIRSVAWAVVAGFGMAVAATSARSQELRELHVLSGHLGAVNAAEFTPSGDHVISVSSDETARLWDAATGEPKQTFRAHTGPIYCLAISGNGRVLATGAQDNTVRIWDIPQTKPLEWHEAHQGKAASFAVSREGVLLVSGGDDRQLRLELLLDVGQPVQRRAGHEAAITCVALRADDGLLASADESGQLMVWSPFLDTPLFRFGSHAGPVSGLAFHPNNQQILSAGRDGRVRLWQAPLPGRPALPGHAGAIRALLLVNNQPVAVTAGADGVIRVIDVNTGLPQREITGRPRPVSALGLSPNNGTLAAGDDAGEIQLFNFGDAAPSARVGGHTAPVRLVTFHADQQRWYSLADDGTWRLWKMPVAPLALAGHGQPAARAAFSDNGQFFVTASADQTLRVWNASGQALRAIAHHKAPVTAVDIRRDSTQVASGDGQGQIVLSNPQDGALQGQLGAHAAAVTQVMYADDGQSLVTAGADGALKQWRLPLEPPRVLSGHGQAVRDVAATADGSLAVTASLDQTVRVWQTANGQQIRALDSQVGPAQAVALHADQTLVAAAGDAGILQIWQLTDGAVRGRLHNLAGAMRDLAFHPTSPALLSADADGAVRYWQLEEPQRDWPGDKHATQFVFTNRQRTRLAICATVGGRHAVIVRDTSNGNPIGTWYHDGPVTCAAFNADATRLVSGSADRSVRVWNLNDVNAPPLMKVENQAGTISAVALSDDGTQAFSSSADGVIHAWNLADSTELRTLSGHAGQVTGLCVAGPLLYSASHDGTARCWNVADGAAVRSFAHGGQLASLAVSSDGAWLATGGHDQQLKIWKTADGAPVTSIANHGGTITGCAFDSQATLVAALVNNQFLRTAQLDGQLLERIELPNAALGLAFAPDDLHIIAAQTDGTVKSLPVSARFVRGTTDAKATCVAWSRDGAVILIGTETNQVLAYETATGKLLQKFHGPTQRVTSLAVSADGAWLSAACADQQAYLWKWQNRSGDLNADLKLSHPAAVQGVAFSATSDVVASTGDDALVRLWDLATGRELERFAGHTAGGTSLTFAGKLVVSAAADNSVRVWTPAAMKLWTTDAISDLEIVGSDAVWLDGRSPALATIPLGSEGRSFAAAPAVLTSLTGRASAPILAACDPQGRIHVWSAENGQLIKTLETGSTVSTLALNADGSKLAVALPDRVRILRTEDGTVLEDFDAAPNHAELAWSPDGQALVAASHDGTPWLYRPRLLRLTALHSPGHTTGATFGNGDLLISGGADGKVLISPLNDGQPARTLAELGAAVTAVAVSTDGGKISAAAADKTVRVWNAADAALLATLELTSPAQSLAFTPDGQRLAAGGENGRVDVFETAGWLPLEYFTRHTQPVTAIRFTNDNRTFYTTSADKTFLGQAITAQRVFAAHDGGVHQLALLTGGGQFVTCGADQRTVLWDTNSGQSVRIFEGKGAAAALAVRADNQRLLTGGDDGSVHLWNLGSGDHLASWDPGGPIAALTFSPDNQKIAVADRGGGIHLLAAPNPAKVGIEYELQHRFVAESPALQLSFTSDSRIVRSCHATGQLAQWAYASPVPVRQFNHGGAVFGVALNHDGTVAVSCSADQTLRTWDLKTGGQRAQLNGHQGAVYGLAQTHDGALAVSSGNDGTLRLWDVVGGRQLKQLATTKETAYALTLSPNGTVLAAGGADRQVHLYDLLTGNRQRTLEGHPDFVHSVSFNPAGTRLLSYGYAGHLIVWNAADGSQLYQTRIGRVGNTARYAADGTRVVLANGDGTARIVELPPAAR